MYTSTNDETSTLTTFKLGSVELQFGVPEIQVSYSLSTSEETLSDAINLSNLDTSTFYELEIRGSTYTSILAFKMVSFDSATRRHTVLFQSVTMKSLKTVKQPSKSCSPVIEKVANTDSGKKRLKLSTKAKPFQPTPSTQGSNSSLASASTGLTYSRQPVKTLSTPNLT